MIKLSLFILDPVAAHGKYMEEIKKLKGEHKEREELLQKMFDKQMKKNNKLRDEIFNMKRALEKKK